MQNKKFPKIGVGIIVKKGNKILLLKRKGSHGEGEWALPGGYLEFGETLKECAAREVGEEVKLDIQQENLKFVSLSEQLDYIKSDSEHCITVGFVVEYKGRKKPKIGEPDKCTQICWFDLNNLPELLFVPSKDGINNYKKEKIFKVRDENSNHIF